jgi:hypothetical protein
VRAGLAHTCSPPSSTNRSSTNHYFISFVRQRQADLRDALRPHHPPGLPAQAAGPRAEQVGGLPAGLSSPACVCCALPAACGTAALAAAGRGRRPIFTFARRLHCGSGALIGPPGAPGSPLSLYLPPPLLPPPRSLCPHLIASPSPTHPPQHPPPPAPTHPHTPHPRCPMCSRSFHEPDVMRQLWDTYDDAVAATPMPPEYADLKVRHSGLRLGGMPRCTGGSCWGRPPAPAARQAAQQQPSARAQRPTRRRRLAAAAAGQRPVQRLHPLGPQQRPLPRRGPQVRRVRRVQHAARLAGGGRGEGEASPVAERPPRMLLPRGVGWGRGLQ